MITISRSKEYFTFPVGPGCFFIDHDGDMSAEDVMSAICQVEPAFESVGYASRPSTSSFVYGVNGEEYSGSTGQHIYIPILDASRIPEVGEVLFKRLCTAGNLIIKISKSGGRLVRSIIDKSVYTPERLIFEHGMELVDGLVQRRPPAEYVDGPPLNPDKVKPLNDSEEYRYRQCIEEAKVQKNEEAKRISLEYTGLEAEKLACKHNIPIDRARKIVVSRIGGVLTGSDQILFDHDEDSVAVSDVLLDLDKYDYCTLSDPIDRDERGKAIFYANRGSSVQSLIYSHARGGRTFLLKHDFHTASRLADELDVTELSDRWESVIKVSMLSSTEKKLLLKKIARKLGVSISDLEADLGQVTSSTLEDSVTDPELLRLNEKYGFAILGSTTVIVTEEWDPDLNCFKPNFYKPEELAKYYRNKTLEHSNENAWKAWEKWERRRTYGNVIFSPDPSIFRNGPRKLPDSSDYNVFQGYGIYPVPGEWPLLYNHFLNVWCGGSKGNLEYLLNWFALMFRRPAEQGKTIPVLPSIPGTGKSIIIENVIMPIFGIHGMTITKPEHIMGRFNAHLGWNVFLFANESLWGGDKKNEGAFKELIDPYRALERKFMDPVQVRNYSHVMLASNNDWAAPVALDDRRVAILPVSDRYRDDRSYFTRLIGEINNGGREAFFYDMLHRDLSEVDPFALPPEQGGSRLLHQLKGASPEMLFVYEFLRGGEIVLKGKDIRESHITSRFKPNREIMPVGVLVDGRVKSNNAVDWRHECPVYDKDDLYEAFMIHAGNPRHLSKAQFYHSLYQIFGSGDGHLFHPGRRMLKNKQMHIIWILELPQARLAFERVCHQKFDWGESEKVYFDESDIPPPPRP